MKIGPKFNKFKHFTNYIKRMQHI